MCGRYSLATPWKRIAEKFGIRITDVPDLFPHYNVAPSQSVLAVGLSREGQPAPAFFKWGLVPSWAHEDKHGPINARAETVADRNTFAEAFRRRRCLMVADGFYEWHREKRVKQPYHIRLKSREPFAFAGLWESWQPSDGGKPLLTCAMITVPANDVVTPIHNRMPAILRPEDHAAWIDRQNDDPDRVLSLVRPYEASEMEAVAVGSYVNDARHEGPECLTPVA